ncbi:hypothetical protein QQX98_004595 [Neonectria punicea]|uniref:Uncharacterized protein n=1 Tax=Neonectria punicea TaxID=979145 RepID=A0ABR1H8L8_9HYPO
MANMHPQTESPFFRLPGEIRERIQRFALVRDKDELAIAATTKYPEILFRGRESPLPNVMQTCKKMYTEMSLFAFSEIIVLQTARAFTSPRTGIICHGHLRFERLRRVSLIFGINETNLIFPSWADFLSGLFKHSPGIEHLDFEFCENGVREEVESELSAAEERRQMGKEDEGDAFILKHYPQPEWVEEMARQPSLRKANFEGGIPEIWLESLRRESQGRIQVFSDGVRFREKQEVPTKMRDANDEQDGSTNPRGQDNPGSQDVQFRVVYEPASRFD